MNFVPDERNRMARLRKEASFLKQALIGSIANLGAKGARAVGSGIWRGAKAVGGGSTLGGVGTLGLGAYGASYVPSIVRSGRQSQIEAMTPWQDHKETVNL